jgi:hypothetical protein
MKTKFTPGPWRIGAWSGCCHKESHKGKGKAHPGPRGDDPCVYEPNFVDGLYGIAAEGGLHVVSTSYDELVMTEADAHLIAAAPDLLEALETMLDCFVNDPIGWMDSSDIAIEKAYDAIHKAKGD